MTGQQNSGNLINRTIESIKKKRDIIISGNVNCIPSPFERFSSDFVGIEQGRYYLVSANQKGAKTQFTSFTFIFHPILYSYYNRDKIKVKIFYYPLEETPEAITLRFMSYLLFRLSRGKYKVSSNELRSVRYALPIEVIDILESDEYKDILNYYEECIDFRESQNPTGCWKDLYNYAEMNGTTHRKKVENVDPLTGEITTKEVFDYYVPNNPNEYVFIIYDHLSLLGTEKGMSLRESMNKLSEYMVHLRNKFNYIPVVIQQQSQENQSNDAVKLGRLRPSVSGLSDSKYTSRDCDVMLGLFNPYSYDLDSYLGYDIKQLKGNARFLEIVVNRHGVSNGICPLMFLGEVCHFKELPLPNDIINMNKVYNSLSELKKNTIDKVFFLFNKNKSEKDIDKKKRVFNFANFLKNGKLYNYFRSKWNW